MARAQKPRRRARGLGTIYQQPGRQTWSVSWTEAGERRYQHGLATKGLADRVRAQIALRLQAGQAALPPDPKAAPTLRRLAEAWLERRKATHRSQRDDASRWRAHLAPVFGGLRPAEVDGSKVRRFIEDKLADGMSPATVRLCCALLSTFFTDLREDHYVTTNPVIGLTKKTKRLMKSTSDPRQTPFLESLDDVARVFQALKDPTRTAFAIGAFSGLRVGEILGLAWEYVDLEARRIDVVQQVNRNELARLKDDESRSVPIQETLAPVLGAWKLKTGGKGLLFQPKHKLRGGTLKRPARFMLETTLRKHLDAALETCKIPRMTLYHATRHSFASLWVLSGGSMEKLSQMMGHSSTIVTQRYAHLRPDLYPEADFGVLTVDLHAKRGEVVDLGIETSTVSSRGANGRPKRGSSGQQKSL